LNKNLQYLFFLLPSVALAKFMVIAPAMPEVLALGAIVAFFGFAFWRMDKQQYQKIEELVKDSNGKIEALDKKLKEQEMYLSSMKLGNGIKR